ncbi:MAG TPA: hypothetical protein VFA86_06650 [Gammaproteobacteria bacterium]|nr:hypothetical protein [Gammaproteobacteria bacterium]
MDVYFMDCPLTDPQVCEAMGILANERLHAGGTFVSQYRFPNVLPVVDGAGRSSLPLRDYIPTLRKHFVRAGAARRQPPSVALLLPRTATPLSGALALALRDVARQSPWLIMRCAGPERQIRLVDTRRLVEMLCDSVGARLPGPWS